MTIIISLSIYKVIPNPVVLSGMVLALIAIFLMAIDDSAGDSADIIAAGEIHAK
jgi:hypothetical protein